MRDTLRANGFQMFDGLAEFYQRRHLVRRPTPHGKATSSESDPQATGKRT
jgi:hypothetical protein